MIHNIIFITTNCILPWASSAKHLLWNLTYHLKTCGERSADQLRHLRHRCGIFYHNLSKIIHKLPLLNIDPKTIFSWLFATNVNFLIVFYGFTVFKSLILKPRSQFFAEIKIFILAYFLKQSWEVFTMCKSRKYEDFRKLFS